MRSVVSSMACRGCSDRLSASQIDGLTRDLGAYISRKCPQELWKFGSYGDPATVNMEECTSSKMAPVLGDLVKNADLWLTLLKYFPHGKMRDVDFLACVKAALREHKHINLSSWPDPLFTSWLARSCHIQLSHIRDSKRYEERFSYRVKRLPGPDFVKLKELHAACEVEKCHFKANSSESLESSAGTSPAKRSQSATSSNATGQAISSESLKSSTRVAAIVDFFLPGDLHKGGAESSQHVHSQQHDFPNTPKKRARLYKEALLTPPVPCGRGVIKKLCKEFLRPPKGSDSCGAKAYLERALKGNIRSTVRVWTPEDPTKRMWVEITSKQHLQHEKIAAELVGAINSGKIKNQSEAREWRDRLVLK